MGVRKGGVVVGYANREDMINGVLDDHLKLFEAEAHLLLDESATILDALRRLRDSSRVFVVVMGQVFGIVTKGDLQKTPVRMWLFGMLSLIEMQFLRLIRAVLSDESWTELLTKPRLQAARDMLAVRQHRNEAIDLADCLQFCDKRTIVLQNDRLRTQLGFESKRSGEKILKKLEELRDDLAHSQDIITSRWPELVDLADTAENILAHAEEFDTDSR